MQTVLLTGANGFVGQYLTRLLAPDYRVIATGRGACRLPFTAPHLIYESLELTDPPAVQSIFERYTPAIVIHTAAISKPDDCELHKETAYASNVEATHTLLVQSALYNSFFLFVSTDFVFDGTKGMYSETDNPGAPVNYYGVTKLGAEKLVKKYTYDWAIVRTVLVYGPSPNGRDNLVTMVAKALKERRRLQIFDDQLRTPTYVEDLAAGIKSIIDKRVTGLFHISGAAVLTPYQIALKVAQYLQADPTLIEPVTANSFSQPAARPLKTGFDISKARSVLNYDPITFEEGLHKTLS